MSLKTMCFSLVELGLELMGSGASRKPQRLQTRQRRNVEGLIFKKALESFLGDENWRAANKMDANDVERCDVNQICCLLGVFCICSVYSCPQACRS